MGTGVVNGLDDEVGHDFGERSVVLSASVQHVFDHFVKLVHSIRVNVSKS